MISAIILKTRLFVENIFNRNKSNREIFSDIYKKNKWGKNDKPFNSGEGSADKISEGYIKAVSSFINSLQIPLLKITDIGCGDFRVSSSLLRQLKISYSYTGVDVVPDLVNYNQQKYSTNNINFTSLDVSRDEIPAGDVCMIRQVLQHLSNAQIKKIVDKALQQFQYIIVCEHYPHNTKIYNKDKPAGSGTRVLYQSAVCLDKPPFNIDNISLLDETYFPGGYLRTFLILKG